MGLLDKQKVLAAKPTTAELWAIIWEHGEKWRDLPNDTKRLREICPEFVEAREKYEFYRRLLGKLIKELEEIRRGINDPTP